MAPGPRSSATGIMHMIVRQLFSRLVFCLQFESSLSMEIISFWLWLEGIGRVDFLACVESFDNQHLLSIALGGKMFVETLRLKSRQPKHRSVQGVYFHKEAAQGIVFYLNNVCYKVLQDILEVAEAKERIHRAKHALQQNIKGKAPMTMMSTKDLLSKIKASYISARGHEEGTSSRSLLPSPKVHILKDIENPIEQCLSTNPLTTLFESLNMKEEEPEPEPEPEPAADDAALQIIQVQQHPIIPRDERTLFVTFSNGYPFTADEPYEFFDGNFGDVELISVQEPIEPKPPLYAHITFFTQETLYRILDGHPRIKFVIRGKHLWARKFVPKRKKAQNS